MKNQKIIKKAKQVEGLRFKLLAMSEDLRELIIDGSRDYTKLLEEYKKIKKQLENQEEVLKKLEAEEQEEKNEKQKQKEIVEKRKKEKREKIKKEIIDSKNQELLNIEKRQKGIKTKIENLEYKKEQCLQKLDKINSDVFEAKTKLEEAKNNADIENFAKADENIKKMMEDRDKNDQKLRNINARLALATLKLSISNQIELNNLQDIIELYNEDAKKYGLDIIDVDEFMKKHQTEYQLKCIRQKQQQKYRMSDEDENNFQENSGYFTVNGLTNQKREEIENDSKQRVKEKSILTKFINFTRQNISKIAKNVWNKIRISANGGLINANKLMLSGATQLRKKLEKDAKIYEYRESKLEMETKKFEDKRKALKKSVQAKVDESKIKTNSDETNEKHERSI